VKTGFLRSENWVLGFGQLLIGFGNGDPSCDLKPIHKPHVIWKPALPQARESFYRVQRKPLNVKGFRRNDIRRRFSDKFLLTGLRQLLHRFGFIILLFNQATAARLPSYNEAAFRLAGETALTMTTEILILNNPVDSLTSLTSKATHPMAADSSIVADSILVNAIASPLHSERAVETRFWHDIAIYNWHTRINILQALSPQWQLSVAENFVSTLQRDPSRAQPDRWKDAHDARVVLRRTPWEGPEALAGWQWQIGADSKIFRDEFSRQAVDTRNNDFSLSGFYSRLERGFGNNLRVGGQVGYRLEQLLARKDHGPNLELRVNLAPTLWQNYYHRFDAEAEINKLSDRRNDDVQLSYGVSRHFENSASDSLFLHFTQLRRESYFADTTLYIDLLSRNRRALENRLHYRISDAWWLSVRTELGESKVSGFRRQVERSADSPNEAAGKQNASEFQHTDFDVRHLAKLHWQRASLSNEWTLQFLSQTVNYSDEAVASPLLRRYPGVGFDSKDWHFTLSHRLRWRLGRRDSLLWHGSATRYAHETGNRNNPDHFDRLTFQANLAHRHRFAAAFLMQWEAQAYLEHHVYLKRTHSAGNYWRRVFKLQPSFIFAPVPGLHFKQSFGILAQYIVYDFPEPLSRGQNNVFRNFFLTDSLSLRLSRQTQFVVQYNLRLEERGFLDWARWRQRPWFDRNEHWVSMVFDHRPAPSWQLAPGVTYLRQSDWRYRLSPLEGLTRYRSGGQTILSPTLSVSYVRSPRAVIIFSARRQMVFRDRGQSSATDYFNLTAQWSI
jgi:hypothetical protein